MITSTGSFGKNVMAAEWTMQVSYEPPLVAVFVHDGSSTLKNIRETKEFGVNVASDNQTSLVNIAGGYSRTEIDKLDVKDSFRLVKSKIIKAPIISDSILTAECKLHSMKKIGDHTMIVGKIVSILHDNTKRPLIYHTGRYYKIGNIIESFRQIIHVDKTTFDWFIMESDGRFVLKCVGVVIKHKKKIMVLPHKQKNVTYQTIPYAIPKRGSNYIKTLEDHLKKSGLNVILNYKPVIKKLMLSHKKKIQRINFVLFEGKLESNVKHYWKNIRDDPVLKAIET